MSSPAQTRVHAFARTCTTAAHPPPPARDPAVAQALAKLRAQVAAGKVDAFSAVAVIRAAASAGAGWAIVEDVVVELAKGADGIAGTADDLIPASTLHTLRNLMHSGVLKDLVAWGASMTPRFLACLRGR